MLVGPKKEDSKGREEWLFPKGHRDNSEQLWETAVREVAEETGIVGRPIAFVGQIQFRRKDEQVFTDFYLMEAFSTVAPDEVRRWRWFEYTTALDLLTHSSSKDLLRKAEKKRLALRKVKHSC